MNAFSFHKLNVITLLWHQAQNESPCLEINATVAQQVEELPPPETQSVSFYL